MIIKTAPCLPHDSYFQSAHTEHPINTIGTSPGFLVTKTWQPCATPQSHYVSAGRASTFEHTEVWCKTVFWKSERAKEWKSERVRERVWAEWKQLFKPQLFAGNLLSVAVFIPRHNHLLHTSKRKLNNNYTPTPQCRGRERQRSRERKKEKDPLNLSILLQNLERSDIYSML